MNTIALLRENPNPTDEEILPTLPANLCRCSGYVGQLRGIRAFWTREIRKAPWARKALRMRKTLRARTASQR